MNGLEFGLSLPSLKYGAPCQIMVLFGDGRFEARRYIKP